MSAPAHPAGTSRRQVLLRYLLGAIVVVVLVVAIGPRGRSGPPLDPRSTSPVGTRGIVEVLERLGVDVRVDDGAPTGDDGVALVITDGLSDAQRGAVTDWVADGGRLVLADPFSDLAPDLTGVTSIAFTEPTIEPDCDDPLVDGVDRVAVQGGSVFDLGPDATGCFPRNDGHWMVRTPRGEGEVISIGGPFTLTNQLLDVEDTAVLLVNLLTPEGEADLHVITPDDPAGAGAGEGLADLLGDQVAYALLQLPLAWLALVWWRARRHGRPVGETTPVRIEAAETTVAVGNLLSRAGRAPEAAAIMRAHVHRQLTQRLGIPAVDDPETFVTIAAARTDLTAETLRSLLLAPLPTDDAGLVRYANAAASTVARIRQRQTADPRDGSTAAPPTSPHPSTTTGAPSP
ncbi:DUF4350 domain-containing protein [Euzebya sp.]|uniref:DUF4350 domain-containing protein n=1 Tax=Euzebya sp. TaxID=1971409 RepID=UPI003518E315